MGNIVTLPIFTIVDRPDFVPVGAANINAKGVVCVASNDDAYIEPSQAVETILWCVDRAEQLIIDAVNEKHISSTTEEFSAYWEAKSIYLLGINGSTQVAATYVKQKTNELYLIADPSSVKEFIEEAGLVFQGNRTVIAIKQKEAPFISPSNWPPDSCQEIALWLSETSLTTLQSLHAVPKTNFGTSIIIVQNAKSSYAFSVNSQKRLTAFNGSDRKVAKLIFSPKRTPLSTMPILRWNPIDISPQSITQRNLLPDQTHLAGKKVVLIGCGTIGGYIAPALARVGAGCGSGQLHLHDPQLLSAGNIGRHQLGAAAIGEFKASALEEQIRSQIPNCNVKAYTLSAIENVNHMKNADLIVDATGLEGVSLWLTAQMTTQCHFPPIVHSWIEGNGVSARAFIQENRKQACYSCVHRPKSTDSRSSLKPEYELTSVDGGGCNDHRVPFLNSGPLIAAGLVVQLAVEWANGSISHRMRNVLLDNHSGNQLKDRSPNVLKDCPNHSATDEQNESSETRTLLSN